MLQQVINKPTDYIGMSSGKLSSKNTVCTLLKAGCWCYDCDGQVMVTGGSDSSRHGNNNNIHFTTDDDDDKTAAMEETKKDVVPGFGEKWKEHVTSEILPTSSSHQHNSDHKEEKEQFTGQCLVFQLKGNRFLRRMVRKIVNSVLQEAEDVVSFYCKNGTMTEELEKEWIHQWEERVQEKIRSGNGPAPPGGLLFWSLEVDPTIAN